MKNLIIMLAYITIAVFALFFDNVFCYRILFFLIYFILVPLSIVGLFIDAEKVPQSKVEALRNYKEASFLWWLRGVFVVVLVAGGAPLTAVVYIISVLFLLSFKNRVLKHHE